jgi:amino acid permease
MADQTLILTVITGVLTVIFGFCVYLFFPDSPLHAKFLTHEERAQAILRIKENHSGIEQKMFKRYQWENLLPYMIKSKY